MNKWTADSTALGQSLFTFVRQKVSKSFSLKDIRWAIEHNRCYVNGKIERFCSHRLRPGDTIRIEIAKKPVIAFDPSKVLFEDSFFLIYDKPSGVTSEDLASRLRLFLVHRLDRDTTGAFLLAKHAEAQSLGESLFRERTIKKSYLALVSGSIKGSKGIIENAIGKIKEKGGEGYWGVVSPNKGLYAKTEWECIDKSKAYSLMRCFPETGRTHQIRVHMKAIGFPILGDIRYGGRVPHAGFYPYRPLLHAESLSFLHPITQEKVEIKASLPEDFIEGISHCFEKRSSFIDTK